MKRALIISGVAWDAPYQRHHQISEFLLRMGYNVLFLEHVPSSVASLGKVIEKTSGLLESKRGGRLAGLNQEREKPRGLFVVNANFLPPGNIVFDVINSRKIKQLFSDRDNLFDIVLVYLPISTSIEVLNRIKTRILVYDCVRDFLHWPGYQRNVGDLELRIAKSADLILTDSAFLCDTKKELYSDKRIVRLYPSINESISRAFRVSELPKEIKTIVYMGSISKHIDTGLFDVLHDAGYEVHFFGTSDIPLPDHIECHGYYADIEKLASDVAKVADAMLINYQGNMDGVFPAKLLQCMATGLPVYCSSFYDSEQLQDLIYVYRSHDELLELLSNYSPSEHMLVADRALEFVSHRTDAESFIVFRNLIASL